MKKRKGTDVSGYQKVINWKKAASDGIEFAILKIIRKDLNPDVRFEANWQGCAEAGVFVQGVYNYTYATTVQKAESDAKRVLEILSGRRTMVWMDVEDRCMEGLGRKLIDIISAYAEVIIGAGLKFGVYTGQYFYNTYIKPYGGLLYPLWIARYGRNDGTANERYTPQIEGMIGWQYTSRGIVSGISGYVDLNLWYEDAGSEARTVDELAKEVLDNLWGSGDERKQLLTAAGYDYDAVQARVNAIYKAGAEKTYTIARGDTLSAIAKQYDTSVSALVQLNGIVDPGKIYVGQIIRIK